LLDEYNIVFGVSFIYLIGYLMKLKNITWIQYIYWKCEAFSVLAWEVLANNSSITADSGKETILDKLFDKIF